MIQVSIKKQNVITNQASFLTQEEAAQWLDREVANQSFGKNERWVTELSNEDISKAINTKIVIDREAQPEILDENQEVIQEAQPEVSHIEYLMAAEYIVEQIDISAQIQAETEKANKIEAGKKAREACQSVLDYVAGCNLDKQLTIEQITQMQQTFANPMAALNASRPTLAKQLITAIVPDEAIITSQEKDNCLDLLKDY